MDNRQEEFDTEGEDVLVDDPSDIIVEDEERAPQEPEHEEEIQIEETPILKQKEPEPKKVPKQRPPAEKRIHEIQKEKYQALDEVQRLKNENDELRKMADLSTQSAMINYELTVQQRLDRAKQLKTHAIESGDVQAQIEADIELSSAVNEYHKSNDWKNQKAYQDQQLHSQMPSNIRPEVIHQNEINKWVRENTWMNPRSADYQEDLAKKVDSAIDSLDAYLFRRGEAHLRFTQEYFNEIDAYKRQLTSDSDEYSQDEYEEPPQKVSIQRRQIPMRTSNRPPVNPVRGQNSSPVQEDKRRYTISDAEKDIAKRMDVTDKAYVVWREKQMRENPGQRFNGDRRGR